MQGNWTSERIDQLGDLYAAGKSCSEIGAVLGVSRNAIIGKVHRLGLPLRGQPMPKPQLSAEAEEAKRIQYRESHSNNQRLRRSAARGFAMGSVTDALPEFSGALNIPLVDLRDFRSGDYNQCRYIAAEPPGPDYLACGVLTAPGESYCSHCMKITHRNAFEMSDSDKLKKRAHFIRIGNASKIGRMLDVGDAA